MPIEEVQGADEFKRDTEKIKKNLPDSMTHASLTIAQEWVSAATAAANTSQATIAAQSLGIRTAEEGAAEISNDSPLFFGSEFGGQSRPETMHFPPHNGRRGYWFYPAKRANEDRFMEIWDKGVEQAMMPWKRSG
jgi:hypothetical protein